MKSLIAFFQKITGKKKAYCCNDCLCNLYMVLDGEASPEQQEKFMKHIDTCSHCFECYKVDRSVKELIKYKIQNMEVPSSLIESIKNKIGPGKC
ncbi:MAG: zf-HC2 domain-containing protein [Cytophagaceae bacterium]|jgi:anti-sigma factor (TIGR02949 family)|nr:zf-HC2 domain-containing protein [Cytophagaceae bacterium]